MPPTRASCAAPTTCPAGVSPSRSPRARSAGGIGAELRVAPGRRDDEVLFGEGGGRILVSVRPEDADRLAALSAEMGLPVRIAPLGAVGGADAVIHIGDREVRLPLDAARDAYEGGLPGALS